MTKKSAARLERDLKEKEMTAIAKAVKQDPIKWSDLEDMYTTSANMLVSANSEMANLYKLPGVVDNVPDKTGTVDHLRGLSRDLKFFSEELVKIHDTHKDNSGIADTPEMTMFAIKTFEHYMNWQNQYQSVIMPTVEFLASQAGFATEALAKTIAETDPNVITDVEIKQAAVQVVTGESTTTPSAI
jgi:hypothetical protein